MTPGDNCWVVYCQRLRQKMMLGKMPTLTLPVEQIRAESNTAETLETMRSPAFWKACRDPLPGWDTFRKQGFEIEFEPGPDGKIDQVMLRLDGSWRSLMEGR